MKKKAKNDFMPAKQHAVLTTGEVVKMLRELKGWTQEDLAKNCGINATNITCWKIIDWTSAKKERCNWPLPSASILLSSCFRNTNLKQ
jgi:ribosome-binding protein aMBF1 (putative translation factor)